MAEDNITQVKEKCCLDDAKPVEISVETMPVMEKKIQGDDVLLPAAEINHVNLRQFSSGALDKRAGKAQVQTRYRGNQMSSTHDLCNHGKRRDDDLVIKHWKLVKKKNVEESGDLGKGETLRKFDLKKVSRISENKSSNEDLLKSKEKTKTDGPVKCDDSLEKTNIDVKMVSRISESKSSKEDRLKNLKNKEKTKIDEPVKCDDSLEKTLFVVEPSIEKKKKKKKKSIKSVKSEIQQSSEKKILRGSGKKSISLLPSFSPSSEEVIESRVTRSDPRPITTSRSKIGLPEKKEIGSANLVTTSKSESKIRLKRIGLKATYIGLKAHALREVVLQTLEVEVEVQAEIHQI